MQNLNIKLTDTTTTHFDTGLLKPQLNPFSSTKLGLKQRYMMDFLKALKKSDVKKETTKEAVKNTNEYISEVANGELSQKDVLFQEIKGLLADF